MAARLSVRQGASERQHAPSTTRPGRSRPGDAPRPGDGPERPLQGRPWEHTDNVGGPSAEDVRRDRRARRYRLRDDLRGWWPTRDGADGRAQPDRRVGCGIWRCPTHAAVGIHLDPATNVACIQGVQVCGSVWTCPCCSAAIRERRAEEIRAAGLAHLTAGGSLAHLTLTLSHGRADSLRTSLDAVRDAWRAVLQSSRFRRLRRRYGVGFVRALEVTWGETNGWHPHLHLLLFLGRALSEDELDDLASTIHAAWTVAAHAEGRRVSEAHGTRLRPVTLATDAEGLAAYLTKVQDRYGDSRDIGREMTRGDLKRVRSAGGRTPLHLAEAATRGDRQAAALWVEYVQAIHGAKCLNWSVGLREALGLGDEPADEDLAGVGAPGMVLVAEVDDLDWTLVVHYRASARLLTACERDGADGVDRVLRVLRRRHDWDRSRP